MYVVAMERQDIYTLLISGLGLAAIFTAFLVVRAVLRSALTSEGQWRSEPAFTLAHLRDMRDKGLITEIEFDRLKENILQNIHQSLEEENQENAAT